MKNSTILLVDDEPSILQVLVEYLESKGLILITAENGESAFKKFEETSPDMVITDIRMPRMNGDVVCQKIRERSDIPIIVITGLIEEGERLRLLSLGADDYITKPFGLNELFDRLQVLVNRKLRKL